MREFTPEDVREAREQMIAAQEGRVRLLRAFANYWSGLVKEQHRIRSRESGVLLAWQIGAIGMALGMMFVSLAAGWACAVAVTGAAILSDRVIRKGDREMLDYLSTSPMTKQREADAQANGGGNG